MRDKSSDRRLNDFFTPPIAQKAGFIEKYFFPKRAGSAGENPLITGLEYDSRRIKPGNLYFALPGLHADGRAFIPDAIQKGALAIVCQDPPAGFEEGVSYIQVKDARFAMSSLADAFYGFPSRHLILAGVTGTEGKSTTVYLIYQFLKLLGERAGFVSTVQYDCGEGERWNPEHQTTPEATAVHRHLALMRDRGVRYAVLEASSHGLSPKTNRLGDVIFDAGVMTNVTHEHLEFHGTWERYREDKSRLFRALNRFPGVHTKEISPLQGGEKGPEETVKVPPLAVVNADDPSVSYFAAAANQQCRAYSVKGAGADLSAGSIISEAKGNSYQVRVRSTGETVLIRDKLPGAFNAGNVLAALLTVSGLLSLPVKDLVPLVPSLKPVKGRMTAVRKGQSFEVLVDYAHTPSSFAAIFPPLAERIKAAGGGIISVFGSAGERDTAKRLLQGRIAADYSDLIFLTDEDPRGEDPMDILEEIAQGCAGKKRGEELFLIPDRPRAIREAFARARGGDLVLLLGKGHENSIIYAEKTRAYDEITEAEKALGELGYHGEVS
jgi:UDP-N-acetylmuramoyl-L-alanyl-D-glutamate--2,6-diaminopimelate ligase